MAKCFAPYFIQLAIFQIFKLFYVGCMILSMFSTMLKLAYNILFTQK